VNTWKCRKLSQEHSSAIRRHRMLKSVTQSVAKKVLNMLGYKMTRLDVEVYYSMATGSSAVVADSATVFT